MTFDDVYETLPATGWLSRAEARLLWDAAGRTAGGILEIGCYHGRSTCLLAALGRVVYAVDPFEGFDDDDPTGAAIYAAFLANLKARDVFCVYGSEANCEAENKEYVSEFRRWVVLFRQRIEDWTARLTQPIGFAYLDGDHTYLGTLAQIGKALECRPQAIGVHDCNDDGGGAEVKRACLEALGAWAERVERLAVWVP